MLSSQTAFKLASVDGQLGYYNVLTPLYAAFHDDDKTFSLMWTEYDDSFPAFHTAYLADQREYGSNHGILAKTGQLPPPNAYTVSCVPWVAFEHFAVHSYEDKPYYFPSVEAGKSFATCGDCPDMETCKAVGMIHRSNAVDKERLTGSIHMKQFITPPNHKGFLAKKLLMKAEK